MFAIILLPLLPTPLISNLLTALDYVHWFVIIDQWCVATANGISTFARVHAPSVMIPFRGRVASPGSKCRTR